MCGIAGRVVRDGEHHGLSIETRARVLDSIRHRGPDAAGEFCDATTWFGHRRLSIIDLSDAARQPMRTGDGRYVITYNGEVYNFAELAREFDLHGLQSHADTDVVLAAFARFGVAALPRFNGMFAFALYDTEARKVWLARDRVGVKPLCYRLDDHGLVFASEIKAILAMSDGTPQCDVSALHAWAYYGTTLGTETLYRGISKLLPGQCLELDLRTWTSAIHTYWSPAACVPRTPSATPSELAGTVRDLLDAGVRRQLVSDVPVGILLSGGIDSSAITAFATRHYPGRISTYAAGFDFDKGPNELEKARSVAAHFGTDHHELHIGGIDVADVVEKMVRHHDMPFADAANIPLFLMTQKIQPSARVVLQGDGGDELFGGYRRYATLTRYRWFKAMAAVGARLNVLTPESPAHFRRARYVDAFLEKTPAAVMGRLLTADAKQPDVTRIFAPGLRARVTPFDPFARYRACQSLCADRPIVDQMLLIDTMIVLPDMYFEKVDRSTMAASVEARVPFLDSELVEFCLRLPARVKIPGGKKKWLLKQALSGVVPDAILNQPKLGFGVPFGHWLGGALRDFFQDHAARFSRAYPGVLDHAFIGELYRQQTDGERDHSFLLWKALNFMIWANQTPVTF